jgi:phosphohistidine phosphatase
VQLYLVRHATAEDRAVYGGDDPDRRLTDEGLSEANLVAQAMRIMRIEPDLVLTSPYVRCHETARAIASMLDVPLEADPRLAPGFAPTEFPPLWERHAESGSIVVVGHEPDLSALVEYLTGAHVAMPKGGIARIEAGTLRSRCELRWLLRPKQVRLIASSRVTA